MNKVIAFLMVLLGGCAYGIKDGKQYPTETFSVLMGYQAAFRLFDAQPRDCVGNATVNSNLYTDNKTGVIRASLPPYSEGDALRIELSAKSDTVTEVRATVMDTGLYDAAMLDALKRTAESGRVVCRDGTYWNTHRVGS